MQIMCVNDKGLGPVGPRLVYGSIYSVSEARKDLYGLKETGANVYYLKSRFIPLSSIDETEMERNYNIETQKA